MKRSFLLLTTIILFCSTANAQWKINADKLLNQNQGYSTFISFSNGVLWTGGYRQLFFSPDSGKHWVEHPIDTAEGDFFSVNFFDKQNGIMVTARRLYTTSDGGKNWNATKAYTPCVRFAFRNSFDSIIGIGFDGKTYSTVDGGKIWKTGSVGLGARDLALTKDGILHVLAINSLPPFDPPEGIMKSSSDGGLTWQARQNIISGDSWTLSADSSSPSRFYLVNEAIRTDFADTAHVYLTTDNGDSWTSVLSVRRCVLSGALIQIGDTLYAGVYGMKSDCSVDTSGVLRSTDRGATWKNFPGPHQPRESRSMAAIDSKHVFVVDVYGSIWETTNGGENLVSPNDTVISVDYSDRIINFDTLKLGFSSTKSLTITNSSVEPHVLGGIIVGPTEPFDIIAGGGGNFQLGQNQSLTLAVNFAPTTVGPFTDSIVITTNATTENQSHATILLFGYATNPMAVETRLKARQSCVSPNPLRDHSTLYVIEPDYGEYQADVLDPAGRIVSSLGSLRLGSGSNPFPLNFSNLHGGSYILRLSSVNRTLFEKVCVTK